MNITSSISALFSDKIQEIIFDNPEIQFYANHNTNSYMWRDSRFEETKDMFQNKTASSRKELVQIFLTHLKNKNQA